MVRSFGMLWSMGFVRTCVHTNQYVYFHSHVLTVSMYRLLRLFSLYLPGFTIYLQWH